MLESKFCPIPDVSLLIRGAAAVYLGVRMSSFSACFCNNKPESQTIGFVTEKLLYRINYTKTD